MTRQVHRDGRRNCGAAAALALTVGLLFSAAATPRADAQTYSVIHCFAGAIGSSPQAGLILDPVTGNLYSTATGNQYGGSGLQIGTAFVLNSNGQETVLRQFAG